MTQFILKVYGSIHKFNKKLRQADVSAYASSMAFFLFLSLIPMLMILCSILPLTPITEAYLMNFLMELVPAELHLLVVSLVRQVYQKSVGILSMAIVITIWSAGKGMLALMRALNQIHEVKEERGYFRLRLVASGYTVMVLLVLIVTLCLGVFGENILNFLPRRFAVPAGIAAGFKYVRILIMLFLLTLAFGSVYTYIPSRKQSFREQLSGAVFAAAAWNIFSFGFAVYVEQFSTFSAYGTLGTIILLLLWLYFCSYLMLVGAVLNTYITEANETDFVKGS